MHEGQVMTLNVCYRGIALPAVFKVLHVTDWCRWQTSFIQAGQLVFRAQQSRISVFRVRRTGSEEI